MRADGPRKHIAGHVLARRVFILLANDASIGNFIGIIGAVLLLARLHQ
jgi:hypothetical protein